MQTNQATKPASSSFASGVLNTRMRVDGVWKRSGDKIAVSEADAEILVARGFLTLDGKKPAVPVTVQKTVEAPVLGAAEMTAMNAKAGEANVTPVKKR